MEDEIWAFAVGFGGRYSVSSLGRIRRNAYIAAHPNGDLTLPEKMFCAKPSGTTGGYPIVNLKKDGEKSKPTLVHRLVLEAFEGPCPDGMECAHGDGNRLNGRLDNLRWATPTENSHDKETHKTVCKGVSRPMAKLTDELVSFIRSSTKSQSAIARELGVTPSLINKVKHGVVWRHVAA